MKTLCVLLFLALLFSQFNCSGQRFPSANVKDTDPIEHRERPWERMIFKTIDERRKGTDLKSLKQVEVANGSAEIRIWVGFDLSPLRALILRGKGDEWSASYLRGSNESTDLGRDEMPLPPPRNGWPALWEKLNSHQFLNLPDATEIGIDSKYIDSRIIVVEIKKGTDYRAYHMFGLEAPKELEYAPVRQLRDALELLAKEFGVQLYYYF